MVDLDFKGQTNFFQICITFKVNRYSYTIWQGQDEVPRDLDMKVTLDSYSVELYLLEILDSKNLRNKQISSLYRY